MWLVCVVMASTLSVSFRLCRCFKYLKYSCRGDKIIIFSWAKMEELSKTKQCFFVGWKFLIDNHTQHAWRFEMEILSSSYCSDKMSQRLYSFPMFIFHKCEDSWTGYAWHNVCISVKMVCTTKSDWRDPENQIGWMGCK